MLAGRFPDRRRRTGARRRGFTDRGRLTCQTAPDPAENVIRPGGSRGTGWSAQVTGAGAAPGRVITAAWWAAVLRRLAYLSATKAFAMLPMSNRDEDVEILALRHQIRLPQRQLGKEKGRSACPAPRRTPSPTTTGDPGPRRLRACPTAPRLSSLPRCDSWCALTTVESTLISSSPTSPRDAASEINAFIRSWNTPALAQRLNRE